MLTTGASRVVMAQASSVDMGVLFLIVVAACLISGSSSSRDVSQAKQVKELKPGALSGGGGVHAQVNPSSESHPPSSRRRAKRCTCYTYKDKECVYYCHLDIIWINTPEHMVPYGMSTYQRSFRRRRSAGADRGQRGRLQPPRCVCSLQTDSCCSSFCMNSGSISTPGARGGRPGV